MKAIAIILGGIFLYNVPYATYGVDHWEGVYCSSLATQMKEEAISLIEEREAIFRLAQVDEAHGNALEAFDQYYVLAVHHHSLAQDRLWAIYKAKQGIFENPAQAFQKYQQKSISGETVASIIVGWMYWDGFGVPKDEKEAFEILKKTADEGYAVAQFSVGMMYEDGIGVTQNDVYAMAYYTKAADQDFALAQLNLGTMYENGKGASQNEAEAFKWYTKSSSQCELGALFCDALMRRRQRSHSLPLLPMASLKTQEGWAASARVSYYGSAFPSSERPNVP